MVNYASLSYSLSVHHHCCPFPLLFWQRKLTKSVLAIVASRLLCRPLCSSQVYVHMHIIIIIIFTCKSWIYTPVNTHNYNRCFKLL